MNKIYLTRGELLSILRDMEDSNSNRVELGLEVNCDDPYVSISVDYYGEYTVMKD